MIIGETGGVSNEGLTALIYGPPGCGKTYWLSQWPGLFYIDIEGGSASIKKKVPKALIEHHNDLMEVLASITGYNRETKELTLRGQKFAGIETIGVDTIDELNRLEMANALSAARKETPKWDEWNLTIERTRNVLRTFKSFAKTKGLNVVFVSHEEYEKSDLTSVVTGQPNLSGSLPQEVSGWMDIVIHMTTKSMGNETKRILTTQADGVFFGRDRTWALQKFESADGSDAGFASFWAKVQASRKGGIVDGKADGTPQPK